MGSETKVENACDSNAPFGEIGSDFRMESLAAQTSWTWLSIVLLVAAHPIEQSRARLAQKQSPALAYPNAQHRRAEPVAGGRRLCESPAAHEPEPSLCQQ